MNLYSGLSNPIGGEGLRLQAHLSLQSDLSNFTYTWMPTAFGDTFIPNTVRVSLEQENALLPYHSDPQETEPESLPYVTEQPEDQNLIRDTHHGDRIHLTKPKPSPLKLDLDHSSTELEYPVASPASSSTSSQMGRKSEKPRRQEPDRPSSATTRGQNGHASGSMDSHLELRRKHPSLDSPTAASQTDHLMSREDFSLDEKPPPTPISSNTDTSFLDLPRQDRRNFLLLVLLYFLQGIPMGLATGSVPFLLKSHLSYGQIGVFSLASYPYSLKLLWSPIVDAVWSPKLGRRKSWILPMQTCSGLGMIYLGGRIKDMMVTAGASDGSGVWAFTGWWFFLVFLCATQDIAVDGIGLFPFN